MESDKHGGNGAASHGGERNSDRRAHAASGAVPLLQYHHVVLL